MLSCSGRRGAYAPPISIQLSLCFFYDSYLVPVPPAFRFVGQLSFKFATFTIALVSKLNVLSGSPLIILPPRSAGILAKRAFANISGNPGAEGGSRKFVVVRAENRQQLSISGTLVSVPCYPGTNSANGEETDRVAFLCRSFNSTERSTGGKREIFKSEGEILLYF